jgi:hypothetical protein
MKAGRYIALVVPLGAMLQLMVPSTVAQALPTGTATANPFTDLQTSLARAADLEWQRVLVEARPAAGAPPDRRENALRVESLNWGSLAQSSIPSSLLRSALAGNAGKLGDVPANVRLRALGVDAERIFEEEGVPPRLIALAGVESAFNPNALSPKGARGLWQLMPATAARFGLRVNAASDDRLEPTLSTRAAARYLRSLYRLFGDWTLVLAAYNAGEGAVQRGIQFGSTRDFWRLREKNQLPRETRAYVPAVLAGIEFSLSLEIQRQSNRPGNEVPGSQRLNRLYAGARLGN